MVSSISLIFVSFSSGLHLCLNRLNCKEVELKDFNSPKQFFNSIFESAFGSKVDGIHDGNQDDNSNGNPLNGMAIG